MYLFLDIKNMKKGLVIIFGIFLFMFFHETSFAQQVVNNTSAPANTVNASADSKVTDTTAVIINTPKKIDDQYVVPVPAEAQAGKKEEPVIINEPRKIGVPH
jgi:hypothetical protein